MNTTSRPVTSNRIIYTPSTFARQSLLHLQEVGQLQALQVHTNKRKELVSYLFFVVTKGSGQLYYEKKEYQLKQGDCVFIDCRHSYSHTAAVEDLWNLKWVHFYGPSMTSIYDKYIERGGRPVFTPADTSAYHALVDAIQKIAASDDYIRDMLINEKITSLLTLIMSESWHPEPLYKSASKKQSLQEIKSYLDDHYTEHLSLDRLADTFYINKYYLTRTFKEQFGTTILSYLDHIRITHAKQLLRFSDATIESIGREVGIEEPGYFNRVFKKVEGVTPGEYRKRW